MIEIQRHIEVLLLANECVIVPDFGGFMTHRVSAHYDDSDHIFLPPLRTLGFNPKLRINDSLLVQSYVEAYDISYPEALRRIEREVEELKRVISEQGSYTMDDLGTLTVNQDGHYEFTPCEAGILSPDLYGLSSFSFLPLDATRGQNEAQPAATAEEPVSEEQHPMLLDFTDTDDGSHAASDSISIKKSWIRNAVAVAAAVVAFFLFSTPVTNGELGSQAMSQLQSHVLYRLMPQDTNAVPAAIPAAEDTVEAADDTTEAAEDTAPAAEAPIAQPATTYYIILASQVKRSNAEEFVARLQKQGYHEAQVKQFNSTIRVVCGAYGSEEEAHRQLRKISAKPEFAEAWVLKQKAKG